MKVALITGAARGIGRAIATDLSLQGYTIVAHYNTSKAAITTVLAALQKHAPHSITVAADLTQAKSIADMMATITEQFGQLDVVVNTVGNFGYTPLEDTSIEEFDDILDTNVRATFLTIQHGLPLLRKAPQARIINFGCASADQVLARKYATPYYIAKNGVITLTKSWAPQLAQEGITINAISPGIVEQSEVEAVTPMGKPASYSDCVAAVRYLLSDSASYVSGANIEISGGWLPYR